MLFGSHTLSSLTTDIENFKDCYQTKNNDYTTYNKASIDNDLINKGCLLYRLDKIERHQVTA